MPNDVIRFLSMDEVVEIHQRLMSRVGGPPGLRDRGLLESALFRPRTAYYKDLPETAAALFESLLMTHPFVDGNKPVAFFATDVFLRLNGWQLKSKPTRPTVFSLACWIAASTTWRTFNPGFVRR